MNIPLFTTVRMDNNNHGERWMVKKPQKETDTFLIGTESNKNFGQRGVGFHIVSIWNFTTRIRIKYSVRDNAEEGLLIRITVIEYVSCLTILIRKRHKYYKVRTPYPVRVRGFSVLLHKNGDLY